MRFFTARRLALAALLPALLTVTLIPGCSQQGEGERCGDSSGVANNDDCGDGLFCKEISGSPVIDRCCYLDGHVTDSRCIPITAAGGAPGGGGASGAAGANTAGANTAGADTGASAGASSEAGASGEAGVGGH
jgi:hypothetical protein